MNINRIVKLSAAVTLGLSLMGASLAADAASTRSTTVQSQSGGANTVGSRQVIHLGKIVVTAADVEGARPKVHPTVGGVAFLGQVNVTASDSLEARAAAATARQQGVAFLGEVVVTNKDSEAARYAAVEAAAQPGVAFLGTVDVTAKDTKPAFVGKAVVALRRIGRNAMVSMISALAFVRVGG